MTHAVLVCISYSGLLTTISSTRHMPFQFLTRLSSRLHGSLTAAEHLFGLLNSLLGLRVLRDQLV